MNEAIYPYEERVDLTEASKEDLLEIVGMLLDHLGLVAVADTTPDYRAIRLAQK